jgi:hypothetical protein
MEKPTAPIGFFFLGLFKLVFKRAETSAGSDGSSWFSGGQKTRTLQAG